MWSKIKKMIADSIKGMSVENDGRNDAIVLKILAAGKIIAFLTTTHNGQKYLLTYTEDFLKAGIPSFNLPKDESPVPGKTYESDVLWYAFAARLPSPNRPEFELTMKEAEVSADASILEILGKVSRYSISKSWSIEFKNAA